MEIPLMSTVLALQKLSQNSTSITPIDFFCRGTRESKNDLCVQTDVSKIALLKLGFGSISRDSARSPSLRDGFFTVFVGFGVSRIDPQ
jgi:hypothetical protein